MNIKCFSHTSHLDSNVAIADAETGRFLFCMDDSKQSHYFPMLLFPVSLLLLGLKYMLKKDVPPSDTSSGWSSRSEFILKSSPVSSTRGDAVWSSSAVIFTHEAIG